METNNSYKANSNRFEKFSAEGCHASIKITSGIINYFDGIRAESSTYAFEGSGTNTYSNLITCTYGSLATNDTSELKNNVVKRDTLIQSKIIFDGSLMTDGACSNNVNATFKNSFICGLTNVNNEARPGKPAYYKKITDSIN